MIEVVSIAGLATVQDRGRAGRMHQGVPPGGALVPELLARANGAVQNGPGEAGVELFGALTVVARDPARVAGDDGVARDLATGESWTIATGGARVRYLAVRGGIDVPVVQGGRGTLLVAAFGGVEGRLLRRGDRLFVRPGAPVHCGEAPRAPDPNRALRVFAGPDLDRFEPSALDVLLGSGFQVSSRSDRVGVRLSGPPLPRLDADSGDSTPMVRGAIQVPASGEPIVLGPDHPTTGGYPVLATVASGDLGTLMARPVGAPLRFTLIPRAR
jgi:biotin-dependent carboxylase-like uncharacterized protein